eukprot:3392738-Ditylum_brightwellii.AAC.1
MQQSHSHLQQQNPGQENQQYFYPTENAMMQQYLLMVPQYAPAWQHPFANLTNVNPQQYNGNRRKRKNNKKKRQPQQHQRQNQGQH